MLNIYGIPNCNTVSKARKWLSTHDVAYTFHDFKKEPLEETIVQAWLTHVDWSLLINKRGTTYRNLNDVEKAELEKQNISILIANPSIIKRPVWQFEKTIFVGFNEDTVTKLKSMV